MRDWTTALATARAAALKNAGSAGSVVRADQDLRETAGSGAITAGTTTVASLVPLVPADPHRPTDHTPGTTGTTGSPSLVPRPCRSKSADHRHFQGLGTTGTAGTRENWCGGTQTRRDGARPVIQPAKSSRCLIAFTVSQLRWSTGECWNLAGNVFHLMRQLGTGHAPRFL
jgi:hypothetical protein